MHPASPIIYPPPHFIPSPSPPIIIIYNLPEPGRRSSDDDRQISRGLGVMGPRGRWRNALINKCLAAGRPQDVVDKQHISPKVIISPDVP